MPTELKNVIDFERKNTILFIHKGGASDGMMTDNKRRERGC
jgi:1-aminocyclopropane-1-carboxylate deaminase/D-cysteine desulfhydrase-like pyridoxal-dependent ACC family enzyme